MWLRCWQLAARDVALRKESVDRNCPGTNTILSTTASLSARRAWIEIAWVQEFPQLYKSLSARRAWIEIDVYYQANAVDQSRSPQGERG